MSNDQLRLVATVEDRFTGPLSKLQRGIHQVSDDTKRHTGNWRKDWDGAREGVAKFKGVLRGFTPVLSGLGVAGVGVGLSLGGMATALGDFSSKTRNLSQVATRRILMGQGTGDIEADTNAITKNFENPKEVNRRSGAVRNACRTGPSDGAVRPEGDTDGESATGDRDVPWHQRPRSNEPGKMSRLRDDEIDVRGSGERPGDRMMRRFYGEALRSRAAVRAACTSRWTASRRMPRPVPPWTTCSRIQRSSARGLRWT